MTAPCPNSAAQGSYARSAGKLRKIEELCAAVGVHTRPRLVGGVWIVPLLSWYHSTWDRESDVAGARPVEKVCNLIRLCIEALGFITLWTCERVCRCPLLAFGSCKGIGRLFLQSVGLFGAVNMSVV